MSSLRLFKVAMCGLDIIKNFSEMHKLHRLVRVVYALAREHTLLVYQLLYCRALSWLHW